MIKHMLLSYCITVHKSQGSQWPNVYYYNNSNPSANFNNKRLKYTAITRAQEKCTIIDISNTFVLCCRQGINMHYGGLIERLRLINPDNFRIILPSPNDYVSNISHDTMLSTTGHLIDVNNHVIHKDNSDDQICRDFSQFKINEQTGMIVLK